MSDSPIAFIILGIIMVAFSKAVTNLHMFLVEKLYRIKEKDMEKPFIKAYKIFFFVMWLCLGIAMIVFYGIELFQKII